LDSVLEAPAVRTIPQVRANLAAAGYPPVGIGEDPRDRLTSQAPPEVHLLEVAACLVKSLPNDPTTRTQDGPDVGEIEPAQLAHDQDRPLSLGQITEVLEQPFEPLALLHSFRDTRVLIEQVPVEHLGLTLGAAQVDRLVVRDAVEPWPQRYLSLLPRQRTQNLDHRVLQSVLGILRFAEQAQAKPIQLLLVALEYLPEGLSIPPGCATSKALLRASAGGPRQLACRSHQGGPPQSSGCTRTMDSPYP
jgi:hypothetical protein